MEGSHSAVAGKSSQNCKGEAGLPLLLDFAAYCVSFGAIPDFGGKF